MKTEVLLQIVQLAVTLFIGGYVALHLGKFNYKKQKREKLISNYISLNQSISEYQNWYELKSFLLLLNELLKFIKNSLYKFEESNQYYCEKKDLIFNYIFDIVTSNGKYVNILSEDFESNFKYYNYKGKNPFFQLELWLLQLSKKEQKQIHNSTNSIKKELIAIRENYDKINFLNIPTEFKSELESLLTELKEIVYSNKKKFITDSETAEEILFLAESFRHIIISKHSDLFKRKYYISSLTDDYKNLILKL